MRLHILAGALLLASCQAAEAPSRKGEESPKPPPLAERPTPKITGKWQVVALNGRPLNPAAPPILAAINAEELAAQSQCVKWSWAYRTSGAAFSTRVKPMFGPMCARGLTQEEQLFDRIMSTATQIRHLTDGGLYITNRTETMVLRTKQDNP